jgi:hypothetical protein
MSPFFDLNRRPSRASAPSLDTTSSRAPLKVPHLTRKTLNFLTLIGWSRNCANIDKSCFLPILCGEYDRCLDASETLEIDMLGRIARWTHNVLLAAIGLLTLTLVVWAT